MSAAPPPHEPQPDDEPKPSSPPPPVTAGDAPDSVVSPEPVSEVYGMLVVLGCNGHLPGDGGAGRRTSRLLLRRRPGGGNALKPTKKQWRATSIKELEGCRPQASVSYTLGRNQGFVVVEYEPDAECDMFQVGRSTESVIDLVVSDAVPPGETAASDSTISRYACRIIVNRVPPYTPKIFAAGFDLAKRIMLGEHAIRWNLATDEVDGLTTNGVLINKPVRGYCPGPGSEPGPWYEVSIEGRLYPMREHRATPSHSDVLHQVDNTLVDGTVIDLCGVCLVYRSAEGLRRSPSLLELCSRVESLNQTHILCPVKYQTLVIRKPLQAGGCGPCSGGSVDDRQPYVYTGCGHVHGLHSWDKPGPAGAPADTAAASAKRTCPLCMQQSTFIPLKLGEEAALYLDRDGVPNYAFNPCGHMASELTVHYWAALPLLTASQLRPLCPFCSAPLGTPPSIRLLFQSDI